MVNGISTSTQQASTNYSSNDMNSKLKSLGIPDDIVSQVRDAVMEYAKENGITLPQPPQQNQKNDSIFNNQASQTQNGQPPADITEELAALGIPANIINQGQQAVMEYAQENGITLPEPPEPPVNQAGANLDLTA